MNCIGYDFWVNIPAGMKAGKYLQKQLPKNHKINLGNLVDSLEFSFCIAKTKEDFQDMLKECHSCQSGNAWEFQQIWGNIPDLLLIGLMDSSFEYKARCLINTKEKTFAPIYGEKWFLLQSRLIFAGYEAGDIASYSTISAMLGELYSKKADRQDVPKSRIETKTVVMKNPAKTSEEAKKQLVQIDSDIDIDMEEYAKKNHITVKELRASTALWMVYWQKQGQVIFETFRDCKNKIAALKGQIRKFNRKAKKYGFSENSDSIEFPVTKLIPVSEDWYYTEKTKVAAKAQLYLDSEKTFVHYIYEEEAGWTKIKK